VTESREKSLSPIPKTLLGLADPPLLLLDHLVRLAVTVATAIDLIDVHRVLISNRLRDVDGRSSPPGLTGPCAVHHASCTACSKLVDGPNGVDGSVEGTPGVEVLLDSRQ